MLLSLVINNISIISFSGKCGALRLLHILSLATHSSTFIIPESITEDFSEQITSIMVTGIEAAGLVLGAFPLAIEGIKIYCNGIQTIKDMVKYREILSMFEYEISVEDFFFRQTLEGLLEENMPKSDIQRLMNDPGGELWKSTDIQAGLQELLRGDEAVNHSSQNHGAFEEKITGGSNKI